MNDECSVCHGVGYIGVTGKKCTHCYGSGMEPIRDSIVLDPNYPRPKFKDQISIQLRTKREANCISMKDLAQRFNMSITHLSDLELGMIKRTAEEEEMIRKWLGL